MKRVATGLKRAAEVSWEMAITPCVVGDIWCTRLGKTNEGSIQAYLCCSQHSSQVRPVLQLSLDKVRWSKQRRVGA